MKVTKRFSLKSRVKSFGYAINGLKTVYKTEHNLWIHTLALAVVVLLGFFLNISCTEWVLIVIASGVVLSSEILNSAIEYIADFVSPDYSELVGKAKDIAAAAVLVTALMSLVVGGIIFVPKLILLIT